VVQKEIKRKVEAGTTLREGHPLIGVMKGAQQVAMERGHGPAEGEQWGTKEWRESLAHDPDFESAVPRVVEVLEAEGVKVLFSPVCHPELNYIEKVWSKIKHDLRKKQPKTLVDLRPMVPELCLKHGTADVGPDGYEKLQSIRRYLGRSRRFMYVYMAKGATSNAAFDIVQRTTHRKPEDISIADLMQQLKLSKREKRQLERDLRHCCSCDDCLEQRAPGSPQVTGDEDL